MADPQGRGTIEAVSPSIRSFGVRGTQLCGGAPGAWRLPDTPDLAIQIANHKLALSDALIKMRRFDTAK